MTVIVLGLLALGVLIGTLGMRRLGRMVAAGGRWRPAAGALSLLALVAALVMMVRGAALEGGLLLASGVALMLAARQRAVARRAPAPVLARREAEQILGVEADASPAQIEDAYRRLMRRAHPDHGGSAGLAAQLNAARDTLSTPRGRGGTAGRGAEGA